MARGDCDKGEEQLPLLQSSHHIPTGLLYFTSSLFTPSPPLNFKLRNQPKIDINPSIFDTALCLGQLMELEISCCTHKSNVHSN
ncbi:hypothetical protein L6452_40042 [Arctium lappa]|uniref:Uncharacterized protein n=1 Tax=Arctium lappa TaxID=4217 RepID=A0ACB8XU00_ARCLA|nr:hypothetical protein L6452_40042 [Arctium lappa]